MNNFSRTNRQRLAQFTRTTHLGGWKSDLERDSGFSDASSEYLSTVDLTDSEDPGRNGSIIGQDPQVALMGGSYTGISPMIIMNNFVVKQPPQMAPSDKQWGFPSSMEVMPQSQMVLLQPMVSNGSSNSSNSPKSSSENQKQSKGYMPILKSYPKIAPHPADAPTKRAGSSRVRVSSTSGYEQRQRRRHHGHRLYNTPSPQQALQTTVKPVSIFEASDGQPQTAESQEQLTDMDLAELAGITSLPPYTDKLRIEMDGNMMEDDKDQDDFSIESNKLKRFSNTYNILNKSGLLGITMRTKQLIKDNKRTQGQLQQLQEQTALLLEALSSGDPQLWTRLQISLQHTDKEQWAAKAQRVLA